MVTKSKLKELEEEKKHIILGDLEGVRSGIAERNWLYLVIKMEG